MLIESKTNSDFGAALIIFKHPNHNRKNEIKQEKQFSLHLSSNSL